MHSAFTPIVPRTLWDIDLDHSVLAFTAHRPGVPAVHGRFERWAGKILLDELYLERSQVEIFIDLTSMRALRPGQFSRPDSTRVFDAGQSPAMAFRSTQIEPAGDGHYRMTGELVMGAVSRVIVLDVEPLGHPADPWGAERAVFAVTTSIDRGDFGPPASRLPPTAGVLFEAKIQIDITVETVRHPATPGGETV